MKKGVLFVFASYALWGIFPIYFHTLQAVSAFQIVAHRFTWSFLFLILVVALRRELGALRKAITRRVLLVYLGAAVVLGINWATYVWSVNNGYVVEASLGYFINPLVVALRRELGALRKAITRRVLLDYLGAAVVLGINWATYVWSVNNGYVVEASLGYFINPLVSVLLGIVFLQEKLRPAQWVPVGIAAAGVIFLTVSYGGLPWVSLALAVSFGLYGLIKKTAPLASLHGLSIETATMLLPAVGFLLFSEANGTGNFGHLDTVTTLLLMGTGVVTAIPLLLFAAGMREVPLTIAGLLQYISPTLQFICGVFIFHEAFSREHLIGFCIIWLALIIFSAESFISRRRSAAAAAPAAASS